MTNSTLSSIGGVIQGNWLDEEVIAGVADGVCIAGDMVGFNGATGAAGDIHRTFKTGSFDEFVGILLPQLKGDMDTLVHDGDIINIVIPQSGHLYGVHTGDLDTSMAGEPLLLGATDGTLSKGGDAEIEHIARLYKGTDNDTYNIIIWGV